jgi:hypothetical protein
LFALLFVARLKGQGEVLRTFLLIFMLICLAGAGAWLAQDQSWKRCGSAAFLVSQAAIPTVWLDSALGDRFLAPLLRAGEVGEVLQELRSRAGALEGALHWHLSPDARQAFGRLAAADPRQTGAFLEALKKVASIDTGCPAIEDPAFSDLLQAGERYWRSRQKEVRMARLSFARDREIFCQADALTFRLRQVLAASEERCARAGSRRGASQSACGPEANESILTEIADIERQREFNYQKLRRKWPTEILEGLQCS